MGEATGGFREFRSANFKGTSTGVQGSNIGRFSADRVLFGVTLTLVFFGLLMVFSSSAPMASEDLGSSTAYFWRQVAWAILGLGMMLLLMRMDYRYLSHPAVLFPGIFIAIVLLVAVLFAAPVQNTNRWLRFGIISFQPSEFAKLMVIIFLAYWLDKRSGRVANFWQDIVPPLSVITIVVLLILKEPDLGTPIAIGLVTVAMFFIAGLPIRYLGALAAISAPAFYLLVWRIPYRRARIESFLDPYADPLGSGFQVIQSMISVSTGGVAGQGLMNGRQKLFFLPAPHTDFIFAVTAEELGLWGALLLIGLFILYFWRGWRTSMMAPDDYGCYLAAGLTLMIFCQSLINMSVVLALIPPKGIPLPFLSYGGSSLFFCLAATGILLSISRRAQWGEKLRSIEGDQ
ncbi:MAG: putative lipid II flippase FtsW [Acidobacteria bacterium]|nr:putative lipid II flippase FtsW [Acidobacteriota bacterium]